ncbi:COG4315 family predicted lipoprotein [Paracoccus broussonetiae]|uniref:Lipoprotein with Yx(FWY)xxD motif n=1 Tax=Paracoccus broussonetiae subsp. drimophilus TaxID=3373869 RepID=A0ABW7LM00_9RHOB
MKTLMILAALALSAAPALAQPAMVGKTASGEVLVDAKGMTLYTFDKDGGGASACVGECAVNWPPLPAASDAKAEGDFAPIARADGSAQWAYKGKPLYTWIKDKAPGDITGDGVKEVWHLARP